MFPQSLLYALVNFLEPPPDGTLNELAQKGVDFFGLWIGRIGMIVAFCGAIKLALSFHEENPREQVIALTTMVSGFLIYAAVSPSGTAQIFAIPEEYTAASAEIEFTALMTFIKTWVFRVGMAVMFFGAVAFAFAFRDNNPGAKVISLRTMAAGGIAAGVAGLLTTFVS